VLGSEAQRPFPDYVTCPQCGEPEVEVWCYATTVRCHACGQVFEHALPLECVGHCEQTTYEIEHSHNQHKLS